MQPLTDAQQALVAADSARLGFIEQSDGYFTWPKFPMWRIEAMLAGEVLPMLDEAYMGFVDTERLFWLAVHAEATPKSLQGIADDQSVEDRAILGRYVGGDSNGKFPFITDLITYIEQQWDAQRHATHEAMHR